MSKSFVVRAASILVVLAVAGNAWAGPKPQFFGYEEWERAVIERQLDPRDVVYPFETTPEMIAWAEEKIQPCARNSEILPLTVLQQALFHTSYSFAYDNMRTLTAADAFAEREGNCMSFTSLFVAVSRSLGYPTFLVSVRRPPGVEKADGVVVVNHHVVAAFRGPRKVYIFDFSATSEEPYSHKRVIDDLAASAIFHTNLGGESIRNGDLDEARRHLEIATTLAPEWAPAWTNLGVTRFRLGDTDGALEAYRSALVADPLNPSALTNMSSVYRSLGREKEAQTALRTAAEGTRSPFTLIAMAEVDMVQGNFESARRYLRRARWWYGKEPEVYDALARLALYEQDQARAEKHSRRAAELRRQRSEMNDSG